jgi:hypothetical protein
MTFIVCSLNYYDISEGLSFLKSAQMSRVPIPSKNVVVNIIVPRPKVNKVTRIMGITIGGIPFFMTKDLITPIA